AGYRHPTRPTLSRRSVSVLMLGRRESGKTVLLASMWRELAFGGSAGVLVTTDLEEDATDLGIVCRTIENPDSELPHSTRLGEEMELCRRGNGFVGPQERGIPLLLSRLRRRNA